MISFDDSYRPARLQYPFRMFQRKKRIGEMFQNKTYKNMIEPIFGNRKLIYVCFYKINID